MLCPLGSKWRLPCGCLSKDCAWSDNGWERGCQRERSQPFSIERPCPILVEVETYRGCSVRAPPADLPVSLRSRESVGLQVSLAHPPRAKEWSPPRDCSGGDPAR